MVDINEDVRQVREGGAAPQGGSDHGVTSGPALTPEADVSQAAEPEHSDDGGFKFAPFSTEPPTKIPPEVVQMLDEAALPAAKGSGVVIGSNVTTNISSKDD